jgi:hypothetical protein
MGLTSTSWRGYRNGLRQATLSRMAITAFCTVCQRTVYLEEGDTAVCPVCSSPLLETVEVDEVQEAKGAREAQAEGLK